MIWRLKLCKLATNRNPFDWQKT
uniref:Uncharacterized protein n=1 Tax=Rhizophora mucronata TaxID=61149 RepID=A0A2P2PKU9_RHIMU